jgi:hypothetical protein
MVLAGAIVVTELCPVVFGTGTGATVDYGFFYVTMHFVLVPIASLVLLVAAGLAVVADSRSRRPARAVAMGAVALLPVLYLIALALYPGPWVE